MSKVSVQQLLRPTDTCIFIIHGKLLNVNSSNEERLLAIVKHEGTDEHALFVFEVDHLGSLSVDMLIPIYDMFTATLQSSTPVGCRVEINMRGDVVVFLLPYETNTALFFSQVTLAKETYISSSITSNFQWLHGYESCRTGWDRFTSPGGGSSVNNHTSSNNSTNNDSSEEEIRMGFPDNWPWGYIITPNPDGRTDHASEIKVCETLVNEFDPLRSSSSPAPLVTVRETTPTNSSHTRRLPPPPPPSSRNPFLSTNPFENPVRPCRSETNISQLQLEHTATPTPSKLLISSHSQENLLKIEKGKTSEDKTLKKQSSASSPRLRFPRERPQGSHFETSPSVEIANPFNDDNRRSSFGVVNSKFWVENSDSELETIKVKVKEGREGKERTGSDSSLKKHASLDDLEYVTVSNNADIGEGGEGERGETQSKLDYNFRRMRSVTSLSSGTLQSTLVQSADHTHPIPAPASVPNELYHKGGRSAHSRSPRLFRKKVKGTSATNIDGGSKTNWVTRYQPGVLLLDGSMRECLIQRMLQEKESQFCERKPLRLLCGTWNVNGQQAMQRLDKWLVWQETLPDIFAIGFQELDLSPEALLRNESNREEMWIDLVEMSLKMAGKYKQIGCVRLVGILLVVYAIDWLVPHISDVETDFVPCGIMGHLGNKGGVAIRFNVYHSSICIVNSHLAAHMDEIEKRNQSYHQIYEKLQFFKSSNLPYSVIDHNIVLWMGDLNYRIQTSQEMTTEIIKALADHYQYSHLLRHDQLGQQKKKGEAFSQFTEPSIDFKPTYKYDPSTNSWDSSEKNRAPAWCDRILYICDDCSLKNLIYTSHPEMIISDHKPVSAVFELQAKVVVPEKERDILEQITWKLDKQENETLPQVELNSLEFKFEKVKFMVYKTKHLELRNVGQRPVQLSFLTTPDKNSICKPWLNIKPDKALILTDEQVSISLTVFIDSEMVSGFNKGLHKIEDILVLHLDGGKDFFISIVGDFLPSCFGSSLETLVHLHSYMREVPTGQLLDFQLSSSWEEYDSHASSVNSSPPPLDIPKELYRLVQCISENGLGEADLFTNGGLISESERIRDALDTGNNELPGSVFSVTSTLLTFLRSLEEPIVPRFLHQRCMDACNNPTLCKQILMQMTTVHRRSFVFLITFLKKLLEHSQENEMDAKILVYYQWTVLTLTHWKP